MCLNVCASDSVETCRLVVEVVNAVASALELYNSVPEYRLLSVDRERLEDRCTAPDESVITIDSGKTLRYDD